MPNIIRTHFNSLSEIPAYIAEQESNPKNVTDTESSNKTSLDDNGFSREQALSLLATGGYWTEGARDLPAPAGIAPHSDSMAPSLIPALHNDVYGFAPDVPAMLSNEPEAMFNIHQSHTSKRVLKIGINAGKAWQTKDHHALNLGRAILTASTELGQLGYALQIDACWYVKDGSDNIHSISTTIKHPEDFLSVEQLAFTLCSTAFTRRICWRVAEVTRQHHRVTRSSYGTGVGLDNPDYDVWVPYLYREVYPYIETPAAALQWIKDKVLAAL